MDYGVLELNDQSRVHLYGTPGQERFRFMWDMLANEFAHDALGMILLVDNTRKDPFRDIRFYAKEFRDYIQKRRLIIAVTHADVEPNPQLNDYHECPKTDGTDGHSCLSRCPRPSCSAWFGRGADIRR